MNDLFKLNVQFDEKGEELEKIISYVLISQLDKIINIMSMIFENVPKILKH